MSTMIAYRYTPGSTTIVKEAIPIPIPAPHEVLLKVKIAGLCHSDLHLLAGEFPLPEEFTLGHEVCGVIVKTGSQVTVVENLNNAGSDELYVVLGTNPCGNCEQCIEGDDHICTGAHVPVGVGRDGGFAEYITIPSHNIVKVPIGVTAAQASACSDAILTPYHAVKTVGHLKSGEGVLIIGLGGIGMNAFSVSRLLGGKVYVTDIKQKALDTALSLGADLALPSDQLEKALAATSVKLVVDCVGSQATFDLAQRIAAPGGRIVLIGLGGLASDLRWHIASNLFKELKLFTSFWGTKAELKEVLELVKEGELKPLVKERPMSELPAYIKALQEDKLEGRFAFIPVDA